MMRFLPFLLIFLLISLQACEDKKTGRENTAEEQNLETISTPQITKEDIIDPKNKKEDTKLTDTVKTQLLVQEELIPFLKKYGHENPENRVRISTKFGDIDILLFDDTPLHRANFILLVKEQYFDETYFYRVVENFVIQAGNSDNPSTNKKRYKIGDYLIPNEFNGNHLHIRGAVSAAKYSEQNVSKASSPFEFFIVQSSRGAHHLDNEHTVFGRVIRGMDVVDKIAAQETDTGQWPIKNIEIEARILD